MPSYQFRCFVCGHLFFKRMKYEDLLKVKQNIKTVSCPACARNGDHQNSGVGGDVRYEISAPALKNVG